VTFLLGPAICRACKSHVFLDTQRRWCDGDGLWKQRHLRIERLKGREWRRAA
jgi:hypothetical protein